MSISYVPHVQLKCVFLVVCDSFLLYTRVGIGSPVSGVRVTGSLGHQVSGSVMWPDQCVTPAVVPDKSQSYISNLQRNGICISGRSTTAADSVQSKR